jgi:hypothetical protein
VRVDRGRFAGRCFAWPRDTRRDESAGSAIVRLRGNLLNGWNIAVWLRHEGLVERRRKLSTALGLTAPSATSSDQFPLCLGPSSSEFQSGAEDPDANWGPLRKSGSMHVDAQTCASVQGLLMGDGGLEPIANSPGNLGKCPNSGAKSDAVGTPLPLPDSQSKDREWDKSISRLSEAHQRLVWELVCGLLAG